MLPNRAFKVARSFLHDKRGVAAIEFAFIAPILLCMYLVTMEVSQGIEANKKLGRAGSMVGDLIAQQPEITRSEVQAIMRIGDSLLQPYNRSQPIINVTAIRISDETTPKATVAWSRKMAGGSFTAGLAKNATVTVPAALRTPNTFLIRVDSGLAYEPVITYTAGQKQALGLQAAFDGISMNETYYLRPRMSAEIPCNDC
ncbi:pilus assembly protein [Tianweitania sediminis]|uniref:Pilus assembly protein n=2 Tax=Tianweitania sediminis TaxID=1502156 RepID=A0A8J7RR70_9HYPH|nr:pilus assembly protein [Tianweitania sediminis]